MSTLVYMVVLLSFLLIGLILGKLLVGRHWVTVVLPRIQTLTLWLLLFMMGLSTGSLDDILGKLSSMGLIGLLSALLAMAGSVLLTSLMMSCFSRKKNKRVHGVADAQDMPKLDSPVHTDISFFKRFLHIVKEPLLLVGIVLCGIAYGVWADSSWFNPQWITYLLRIMMVIVGILLIGHNIRFTQLLSSPLLLFIPLTTLLGSLAGSLFLPLVTDYTMGQSMAVVAGLGWYSLSGVLITDMGYPLVGTVALLSNLMRESLSFFIIPLLARFGRRALPQALSSAAATTMDVTLPLLSTHFGPAAVGISIYNGVVSSLVVPMLIPFLLRMGA